MKSLHRNEIDFGNLQQIYSKHQLIWIFAKLNKTGGMNDF